MAPQLDHSQGIKHSFHTPHLRPSGRFWEGGGRALTLHKLLNLPMFCSVAACLYCSQLSGLQRKSSETEVSVPIFLTFSSPFQPRPQAHTCTGLFPSKNILSYFGPAPSSACTTVRWDGTELFPPFTEALIILPPTHKAPTSLQRNPQQQRNPVSPLLHTHPKR